MIESRRLLLLFLGRKLRRIQISCGHLAVSEPKAQVQRQDRRTERRGVMHDFKGVGLGGRVETRAEWTRRDGSVLGKLFRGD